MGQLYVCADTRFFDESATEKFSTDIESYNDMIIDKWNKIIGQDDSVVVIGDFSHGSLQDTVEICNKLNGKKNIYSFNVENSRFTRRELLDNCSSVVSVHSLINGMTEATIKGKNQRIIIYTNEEDFTKREKSIPCAAPLSVSKYSPNQIYENDTLNISAESWNFEPLLFSRIGEFVSNFVNTFEEE